MRCLVAGFFHQTTFPSANRDTQKEFQFFRIFVKLKFFFLPPGVSYYSLGRKFVDEKNPETKILCHCPFHEILSKKLFLYFFYLISYEDDVLDDIAQAI